MQITRCSVCNHINRDDIEKALSDSKERGGGSPTISELAEKYEVPGIDLIQHARMHMSSPSLSSKVGVREGNELTKSTKTHQELQEQLAICIQESIEEGDVNRIPKQITDLYIGVSKEIRENILALAELNEKINGKEDTGADALVALVGALKASR